MDNSNLGFLFPGQGSQTVGMLGDIFASEELISATFAEASAAIDLDLAELAANGPAEKQNLTENTQPLLLTACVALWRTWLDRNGAMPKIMAGHSLGEFTALVCSEAMSFQDAVRLVKLRGQFMQTAVPVGIGAMAAIIGLDDDAIDTVCNSVTGAEVVSAVNYNSPGQVVIAGHAGAVEQASKACKEAGAKRALPLPVSAPFHTSLMQPAGEQLEEALKNIVINAPTVPVIQNVYAKAESDPARIKALLIEQIASPVQWVKCIAAMRAAGVEHFVECGPGTVLSGLNKRIDRSIKSSNLRAESDFESLLAS